MAGLTENGTPAAVAIACNSDTFFTVSPTLEIGSEHRLGGMSVLRPFLRAGISWRDEDDVDLTAAFAAAPAGTNPFNVNTFMSGSPM